LISGNLSVQNLVGHLELEELQKISNHELPPDMTIVLVWNFVLFFSENLQAKHI